MVDPRILIAFQIAAFWSVWQWFFLRMGTNPDTIWSMVAWLGALIFLALAKVQDGPVDWRFPMVPTLLYVVTFPFTPSLVHAVFALLAIGTSLCEWRLQKHFHFGVLFLLIMGLPLMSSLHFLLGFPLRAVIADLAALLLRMNGLAVFREGVSLKWGSMVVVVDAPCSGVNQLWTGLTFAALAGLYYRLTNVRTLAHLFCAGLFIVGANVLRSTSLFFMETKLIALPTWSHQAIGLITFVVAAVCIVITAWSWRSRQ